jgi:hypothetical protein
MGIFIETLNESKKTYKFLVRVAGNLPESFDKHLKTHLEKFSLVEISSPKRTPIQETPMDFPQLQNMEVTTYEVEVNYPTTSHVLEQYLVGCCGVDHTHINVRVPGEPVELDQKKTEETVYEPLLSKEDLGGESAQGAVATNRVMDLLKELEVARKERTIDPLAGTPTGESKDLDNMDNSKSAVGS